jgi:hypothetical protein
MQKRFIVVLTVLCLLFATPASSSVLPVLMTPAPSPTPEPEVTFAPSLQSISALDPDTSSWTSDGRIEERYFNVSYALYERLSAALAEDGYQLVSSESDAGGWVVINVANANATMEISYNMGAEEMAIVYGAFVDPRTPRLYEDFTELNAGDVFSVADGVTIRIDGWQREESWVEYYGPIQYTFSDRFSLYSDESSDEAQVIILSFTTVNNSRRPLNLDYDALENLQFHFEGGTPLSLNKSYEEFRGTNVDPFTTGYYAVELELTADQNISPVPLKFTFTTPSYETRYVYSIDLSTEQPFY